MNFKKQKTGRMKKLFREEREKLSGYSTGKKIEYIWQYYKLWIIGIVCLAGFCGWFIFHRMTTPEENYLFAVFANTLGDTSEGSDFYKGFEEYSGVNTKEYNLIIRDDMFFDPSSSSYNEYYSSFVAYVETASLDVLVMNREDLATLGSTGRLMDLSLEAAEEIFTKYEDRLIYIDTEITDEEGDTSTEHIPVGIDLSDTCLVTEYNLYSSEEGCALGLGAYAPHMDAIITFLEYIVEDSSNR